MEKPATRHPHLWICALLVLAVLTVYWRVPGYGFVAYDDDAYVWANPDVFQGGLNVKSIRWAFTTDHASNWHPLTWLSLLADVQMTRDSGLPDVDGQPNAHYFHITNLALHIANVLLLYLILVIATGYAWRSAFVAMLFAVHPLHVESVAWVTERKDVLSTLFWLLTTLAYMGWVNRRGAKRYALMVALYVLGLMAKPMLVSLPLVLLLMDYWPLRRLDWPLTTPHRSGRSPDRPEPGRIGIRPLQDSGVRSLLIEKLPLFALAIASSIVTLCVQKASGAVGSLGAVPFGERAANAVVAYIGYIVKMVCPIRLAAFYPHPEDSLPVWQVAGAAVLFVALCWFALKCARSRPYVTVGWFWYVITLLPVIGLLQAGRQGAADRYTYVPFVGLFIAIAWAIPELLPAKQPVKRKKEPDKPRMDLAACAAVVVVALAATAYVQTAYWADSVSLFTRAISVTRGNYLSNSQLGNALLGLKRVDEAIEHYREAIRIKPDFGDAHYNLGVALDEIGRYREAIEEYREAAGLIPKEPSIRNNMGYALVKLHDLEGAEHEFRAAVALDPKDAQAHNNLGAIYAKRGDHRRAAEEFKLALELDPSNPDIQANLDAALAACSGNR